MTTHTKTTITMNATGTAPLVVDQSLANVSIYGVDIPLGSGPRPAIFHTTVVAFEESDDNGQYAWVVEFSCGTSGSAVLALGFPGGFVGVNLYSRDPPHTEAAAASLDAMLAALDSLGLAWALDPAPWPGLDTGFNIVPHNQTTCSYNYTAP